MNSQATKLVIFKLGEDLFASDVHDVERVLRYAVPTSVPDMPGYIEGVMHYQDRVVPVVNLRRRLELPSMDAGSQTRTLVLHVGGEYIGAVVDSVTEVAPYDAKSVSPPPKMFRGLASQYLKGIVRQGEKLIIYLDVEHILSSTERIALQQAGAEALSHG